MTFSGKESAMGGPQVVYPLNGSLHPINVLDMTVQWRRGDSSQTVFRLRFQNDRGVYDFFVPCALDECTYPMPAESWRDMAGLNRDRDVVLSVAAAGNPDRVSPGVLLHFSPYRVEGGLYYWSTSLQGTYRLNLGEKKALPFITPAKEGCYGCHAVSRNGKRIAWTDMSPPVPGVVSNFQPRTLRAAPTDMPSQRTGGTNPSTTMTLSPDGAMVLVSDGGGDLVLRDAASAAMLATVPPSLLGGRGGFFPEWSPDGKNIALTLGPRDASFSSRFNLVDAEIAVLPYNEGRFGPATVLVRRDRDIHYYPSWSPDGKWIVFCSGPADPASARTYDNPQSRLRLVAAGGGPVYELGLATQGLGTTASWPKFSPFSQLDGQLLFIGFSSRIDYGFLKRNANIPQLWLAAVDLRRLGSNDPSWAPIWLPFQEVDQNNHLPFWTESLGCTKDSECGEGAVCKDSACVPRVVID
jgi:hypothetical protein